MVLRRLSLRGFRNYKVLDVDLSEGVTLFSGSNAQGKTNLLEGIYALSAGRSFRAAKDSEMVGWGEEAAWAKGWVSGGYSEFTVSLSVSSAGRKTARLNDVEKIRPSELSDRLNAVAFIPDDLDLVKGSPAARRKFLDLQISQLSPVYRQTLSVYSRTVLQKNALLKNYHEMPDAPRLLDIFNEGLVKEGSLLVKMRSDAVDAFAPLAADTYAYIADSGEGLEVTYVPSVEVGHRPDLGSVREAFARKLATHRAAEIARGACLVGPQRDDLGLSVGVRTASNFGSQGQQRTAVISLKLAEAEVITASRGEAPVVLLDDVLSELDEGRRQRLIRRFLGRCQTVITATDAEYAFSMPGCLSYRVTQGEVGPA